MISKTKKYLLFLVFVGFAFSMATSTLAHPGNTDRYGCHTCRTNCAKWGLSQGEYHCHRAKALPQPLEPIKSHKVEGGSGYTTPAPEYKTSKVDNNINTTPKAQSNLWSRFLSLIGLK